MHTSSCSRLSSAKSGELESAGQRIELYTVGWAGVGRQWNLRIYC